MSNKAVAEFSTVVVMLGRVAVLCFSFALMLAYVLSLYKVGSVDAPEINLVWFSLVILGGDWTFEKFIKYWRQKSNGNGNGNGNHPDNST